LPESIFHIQGIYLKATSFLYYKTLRTQTKSNVTHSLFRKRLHDGVIRDIQRQQRRKTENLYLLQQQIELTKQLRKSEDAQLKTSENAG
jgi:hypothetical protein